MNGAYASGAPDWICLSLGESLRFFFFQTAFILLLEVKQIADGNTNIGWKLGAYERTEIRYLSAIHNEIPILVLGSGRVTFNSHRSFMKAVQAAFIEIRTPKFTKKVNC